MDFGDLIVAASGLVLLTSVAHILNRQKKRVRRYKVRPMNRKRHIQGTFATLIKDMNTLEYDKDQFLRYTRLSPEMFSYLLQLVGPSIAKDRTKNPLSPQHRLIMTLHYLAEGCSMQEVAWNFRVGKATVHQILKETLANIWNIMAPIFLPPPTQETWATIEAEFLNRWNVPNCIGAVDGKHVVIQTPAYSGSAYFNYKKSSSLILMAVCDSYYKFTLVDIGAEGSNHDSEVFRASGMGIAFLNKGANVPPPKKLPGTNVKLPHFIVGDSAFPLDENIMRPYPGSNLDLKKNIFNYRISRARRCIENAFGIVAQRWRIIRKPIIAKVENCQLIIQAIVVLHNFIQCNEKDLDVSERNYCPMGFADYVDGVGNIHPGTWRQDGCGVMRKVKRVGTNNHSQKVRENRDTLAEYFVSSQGSLPWQENHVLRGSVP